MGMVLGLAASLVVSGFLVGELLLAGGWRRRSVPVGLLGLAGAVWAAGELLTQMGGEPAQLALGRRLIYAGVCLLPVAWLWLGLRAAGPAWAGRAARIALAAAVFPAAAWSTLLWDPSGLLVDLGAPRPSRGPLFPILAVYVYALLLAGLALLIRGAWRTHGGRALRALAIAGGTLCPVLGNLSYLSGLSGGTDPTPILLALGALALRLAVVDSGLALYVPLTFSGILDQLDVGIFVADVHDRVVYANRATTSLLGGTNALGWELAQVRRTLASRKGVSIDARSVPLHATSEQPVGRALLALDRTEAIHADRRLQFAARLEAVGQLTAGMAHEINNPLAYVLSNLSQLEKLFARLREEGIDPRDAAADGGEMVGEMREGVEHIAHVVEQLRVFVRHDAEAPQRRVDLGLVTRKAVDMARPGLPPDAIDLEVRVPCEVNGQPGQLLQIALNLIVNAIQASSEGGTVQVCVGPGEGGVVLRVLDRGPGIAEHHLDRIYDAFFTTKPPGQGTGLGLSVSHELARKHGGRLEARNRDGGGAEFRLWLPAADDTSPAP